MDLLKLSGVSSLIGATVGGIFLLIGMAINSWLTLGRERRQEVWKVEIKRIVDLEERAGQLVELIGSYSDPKLVQEKVDDGLNKLAVDAGRFRRHRQLMQAIRNLHNGLSRLLSDKLDHRDFRSTDSEVNQQFQILLKECDAVTGKRLP